MYYLAPDSLEREPFEFGYSDFLIFCFSGNLDKFHDGMRWKGWQQKVAKLDGTKGISCVPFLFTTEGKDLNKISRKSVPITELWGLNNDFREQLGIH